MKYFLFIAKSYLIFQLISQHTNAFAVKPIVPTDALSPGEIAQIKSDGNFFFHKEVDDFSPIWMKTNRTYANHFLKDRTDYFSLDEVIEHTLTQGFPVEYNLEKLFRSNLEGHVAIGGVLPRVDLVFGDGALGLNFNRVFAGLFSFVFPSNWMNIFNQKKSYNASLYLLMRTYLDEVLKSRTVYIKQHQLIQEFEIINFYFIHLQILADSVECDERTLSTLYGRFAHEGTNMASQRGRTKLGFNDLSLLMALQKIGDDHTASSFNIKNIEDFPVKVKELDDLEPLYKDKEVFLQEVVRVSIELKTVNELLKISRMNVGITATGSLFGEVDRSANPNHDARFAFRLGYDTLPQILISKSLAKTATIDVRKEYIELLNTARRSFDYYTNSLGGYTEAKRAIRINREALRANIESITAGNSQPDAIFILAFIQLIESELKLNNALHGSLIARAHMDRLLLKDHRLIQKYMPSQDLIHHTLKHVATNQLEQTKEDIHIDKFLFSVHKSKRLKRLFKDYTFSSQHRPISKPCLDEAIQRNLDHLLHASLRRPKSSKFYQILSEYIETNGIEMSLLQEERLQKALRPGWNRWTRQKSTSKTFIKEFDKLQKHDQEKTNRLRFLKFG